MEKTTVVLLKPWWAITSLVLSAVVLTSFFFLLAMGVLTPAAGFLMLCFSLGLGISTLGMLITARGESSPTSTVTQK